MALMESNLSNLGNVMPDFTLKTADGKPVNAYESSGEKGLLIAFTCNHCPYAQAVWDRLIRLAKKLKPLGINSIAVNPNIHPSYPEDSPTAMLAEIIDRGITFPYLVDEKQEVAKAYDAICTPDIYLLNSDHKLFYRGRIDDNWRDESEVTKNELEKAAMNLITGKSAPEQQLPTIGCSIKWL